MSASNSPDTLIVSPGGVQGLAIPVTAPLKDLIRASGWGGSSSPMMGMFQNTMHFAGAGEVAAILTAIDPNIGAWWSQSYGNVAGAPDPIGHIESSGPGYLWGEKGPETANTRGGRVEPRGGRL
jgi:hypothetical protein